MASNITQITDAIRNLNVTFTETSIENIIPVAIESTNNSSNGWLGLTVFIILFFATFLHIYKNKSSFGIFDKFGLIFIPLSIMLDLGIQLLLFGILASVQIFIFIYVVFFVMCTLSLLRKELMSNDT